MTNKSMQSDSEMLPQWPHYALEPKRLPRSDCSLQHGWPLPLAPRRLLVVRGRKVTGVPEGHLCCGSTGTYNLLQPEIAGQPRDRKVANTARTKADRLADLKRVSNCERA